VIIAKLIALCRGILYTAKKGGMMEPNAQAWTEYVFNIYTLIGLLLIVILGVVLGYKEKITVFRNYNDLGLVFLLGLWPIVASKFGMLLGGLLKTQTQENVALVFTVLSEIALALWIITRTYIDNDSVWKTALSLITKITLSFLFVFNVLEFITPSGKTSAKRAQARRSALTWLLILTPVVYALVRNKEGFFNPKSILERRGISA
jgi:MFS-type transporter involved in bile tolerance (Atg22 family)